MSPVCGIFLLGVVHTNVSTKLNRFGDWVWLWGCPTIELRRFGDLGGHGDILQPSWGGWMIGYGHGDVLQLTRGSLVIVYGHSDVLKNQLSRFGDLVLSH